MIADGSDEDDDVPQHPDDVGVTESDLFPDDAEEEGADTPATPVDTQARNVVAAARARGQQMGLPTAGAKAVGKRRRAASK